MVFENRLVRSFLRLLPALGELNMLGKIWYEWQLPRSDTNRASKFDAVVLDFPATGHARAILSAPRAVMASIPKGPMRENALRIDRMLRGPHASLVVVTTPDETPVAEANELLTYAYDEGFERVHTVANRCVQPLSDDAMQAAQTSSGAAAAFAPLHASLALRNSRAHAGVNRLQAFGAAHPELIRLPQWPAPLAREALEEMATSLSPVFAP